MSHKTTHTLGKYIRSECSNGFKTLNIHETWIPVFKEYSNYLVHVADVFENSEDHELANPDNIFKPFEVAYPPKLVVITGLEPGTLNTNIFEEEYKTNYPLSRKSNRVIEIKQNTLFLSLSLSKGIHKSHVMKSGNGVWFGFVLEILKHIQQNNQNSHFIIFDFENIDVNLVLSKSSSYHKMTNGFNRRYREFVGSGFFKNLGLKLHHKVDSSKSKI